MEFRSIFVGANCNKVAADITAISAGTSTVADLKPGEILILDQDGKAITTATQAAAAKHFHIYQNVNGSIISSPDIKPSHVKRIYGAKPQLFLGRRLTIGYYPGANTTLLSILAGEGYGIGVRSNLSPTIVTSEQFEASAVASAAPDSVARLLTEIVAGLSQSSDFNVLFNATVHGAIAGGSAATITINPGSTWGAYATGTLVAGQYINFQHTSTEDNRTMPKGLYRISSVDTVNKTFTLETPWRYNRMNASSVTVVAPVDTDQLGILIEAKAVIVEQGATNSLHEVDFDHFYQGFNVADIIWDGANVGCRAFGHWLSVDEEQADNWTRYRIGQNVVLAVENYYYSSITIELVQDNLLSINNSLSNNEVVIYFQRSTSAELAANTAPTLLTNLLTSTGVEATTTNSVINALNLLGLAHGWFTTGLNTVYNGGKQLAVGIDI